MSENSNKSTQSFNQIKPVQTIIDVLNTSRPNTVQNIQKNNFSSIEDKNNDKEKTYSNEYVRANNQQQNAFKQISDFPLYDSKAQKFNTNQFENTPQTENRSLGVINGQMKNSNDYPNAKIIDSKANSIRSRYLQFKPYYDSFHQKKNNLVNKGYYYKFLACDIKIVRYILEECGFVNQQEDFELTILWTVAPIKLETYQSLSFYQKVNHFPKSHELTRKDMMHRHLARMQAIHDASLLLEVFCGELSALNLISTKDSKRSSKCYIVKPNALSQGEGIFITEKVEEIISKTDETVVVSHYIDDPFLIEGYKFDLRIYVAITSIHPLRIYMYDEGLARFATKKYDRKKSSNGDNINKNSEGLFFKGVDEAEQANCKWSLKAFKEYLKARGVDVGLLFSKIEDLIIKTLISVESTILSAMAVQVPHRTNCFELLGFDVLIDSKLKPWLLEVNLSPSLACETTLDQRIKANLISDLLTLIGIIPIEQRAALEPLFVEGLKPHGIQPNQVNKRTKSGLDSIEISQEEKQIMKESVEENERRGQYIRVFPRNSMAVYEEFFSGDRPYNKLLQTMAKANLKDINEQSLPNLPNNQFLSKEQAYKTWV